MIFCTDLFDFDRRRIKRLSKYFLFFKSDGRYIKTNSYNVTVKEMHGYYYIRFYFYIKTTTCDNLEVILDDMELRNIYFYKRLRSKFSHIVGAILNQRIKKEA